MIRLYKNYFLLALIILSVEVFIGKEMHDNIIRPYGGDFLVVILLYCIVKSFINSSVLTTSIGVVLFAYCVEISQYFHLVNILGLAHSKMAVMLMGTTFSWVDMLTYTLGILLVLIIEYIRLSLKNDWHGNRLRK